MDKPIRVLHVIGIMNRGGAETMIMNLYRHIDRSKVQFDFVENSSEPAIFDEEIISLGGRIYRCPHYNGKNHFTYVKWWNEFFQAHSKEYPIVHGHLGSTAAIYLAIAKKYGVYTIAHSHSAGTDHSMKSYLYRIMSHNTRNVADYFFACSEAAGLDRFGRKVTSGTHYAVLNNAIEVDKFSYNPDVRQSVRRELGYEPNQIVVGHIGRYTKEKNHAFVLEIFSELKKLNADAKLLMIGDGPLHAQIMKIADQSQNATDIRFMGVRSDIGRLLQAIDIFVLPSLYEGLGIVAIEAQTAGVPCCVSDSVPKEAGVTSLLQRRPLRDGALAWAKWILSRKDEPRHDTTAEIRQAGYDIRTTTLWLQHFYEDAAKKHG